MQRRLFLLSPLALPLYPAAPLQSFTDAEARILEALIDQIIPADQSPGAKQAGVLYYLDQQLAGPLQRFLPRYRAGLPAFATLPDLPFAQGTAFLRGLPSAPAAFFSLLVDHTMQGFYGSPEHGGNRDEASWKMLGIAPVMGGHSH